MRKLKAALFFIIIIAILVPGSLGCGITLPLGSPTPASTATPTETNTVVENTPAPTATVPGVATTAVIVPAPTGAPLVSLPDLTPVVDKIAPAVVLITTEAVTYNFFQQPIPEQGAGTGVIFDSRGYIVTNNHVVTGTDNSMADTIKVALVDGRSFDVDTKNNVWTDPLTDLAVIKIEGDNLPVAQFADPASVRPYQWILAIGYSFKLEGEPTITTGIISATGRSIEEPNGVVLYDLIQTDAAINPGNSGGPLVNLSGQVIGINTALISGSQNIGFSINVSTVLPVVRDLVTQKYVTRPWLGVYMETVNAITASTRGLATEKGIFITRVVAGSPAEQAGIRTGDVIIKIEQTDTDTIEDLRRVVQSYKIGDTLNITYMRGNQTSTVAVRLGATPAP